MVKNAVGNSTIHEVETIKKKMNLNKLSQRNLMNSKTRSVLGDKMHVTTSIEIHAYITYSYVRLKRNLYLLCPGCDIEKKGI